MLMELNVERRALKYHNSEKEVPASVPKTQTTQSWPLETNTSNYKIANL